MYGIYIGKSESDNGDFLRMPINPSEVKVSMDGSYKTYNIVDFGEAILPENRKLITVSFSSFFPHNYEPYCNVTEDEYRKPTEYVDKLLEWKRDRRVLRLVILESSVPVNITCLLDNTSFTEKAGETGDIYYDLSFSEYREIKVIQTPFPDLEDDSVKSKKQPRTKSKSIPKIYTVKKGDCLWAIAKRFLNDGSKYNVIADLNNISNTNLILPGQKLKLPGDYNAAN